MVGLPVQFKVLRRTHCPTSEHTLILDNYTQSSRDLDCCLQAIEVQESCNILHISDLKTGTVAAGALAELRELSAVWVF